MKGVIVNYLTSVLARIKSARFMSYVTRYEWGDFADDDLVTKYAVSGQIAPLPPNSTIITAGTTVTPLTVAFEGGDSTSYTLKRASDNSFDWNTNVQYDGSVFTILGEDDGSGKFADSYVFAMKP